MEFYRVQKNYYAITEAEEYICIINEPDKIGTITGREIGLKDKVKSEGEEISVDQYAEVALFVVEESERRGKRMSAILIAAARKQL